MGGELKEASGLCTCSFDPWRPQDNALNGKYLVTLVREYVEIERRKSDSKSILIIYRICNQIRKPSAHRTHCSILCTDSKTSLCLKYEKGKNRVPDRLRSSAQRASPWRSQLAKFYYSKLLDLLPRDVGHHLGEVEVLWLDDVSGARVGDLDLADKLGEQVGLLRRVAAHLSTGTFVDASPCVQFCSTCS